MTESMKNRLKFQLVEEHTGAKIKVIGIGGGGNNAVNHMIDSQIEGVEFTAINTDLQALNTNQASRKIQIGATLTKGLGSGGRPDVGKEAALEDTEKLIELLDEADMIFLTAGLGGGTGTGATPVIANLAAEKNILTIAIISMPFGFEGKRRMTQAQEGLAEISAAADTVIAIPNERLLETIALDVPINDAFNLADDVLRQAVQGISDLIIKAGFINLDFADVKSIMKDVRSMMKGAGNAFMGTGMAAGENRAIEAAQKAISSPLLVDTSIEGAKGILLNITGGKDITLHEVAKASQLMHGLAHPDANIIFGIVTDEAMKDMVKVTVIATGFDGVEQPEEAIAPERYIPSRPEPPRPAKIHRETPAYLFEPKGRDVVWDQPTWEKQWEPYDTPSFIRNKHTTFRKNS